MISHTECVCVTDIVPLFMPQCLHQSALRQYSIHMAPMGMAKGWLKQNKEKHPLIPFCSKTKNRKHSLNLLRSIIFMIHIWKYWTIVHPAIAHIDKIYRCLRKQSAQTYRTYLHFVESDSKVIFFLDVLQNLLPRFRRFGLLLNEWMYGLLSLLFTPSVREIIIILPS